MLCLIGMQQILEHFQQTFNNDQMNQNTTYDSLQLFFFFFFFLQSTNLWGERDMYVEESIDRRYFMTL